MRLYTGTGDQGDTGLLRGGRISKGSNRIDAIGEIDELNAVIGLARAHAHVSSHDQLDAILRSVQNTLFSIGAQLAGDEEEARRIQETDIAELEQSIDRFTEETPPIKHFVLPAGDEGACRLHLARAVARRAERALVRLSTELTMDSYTIIYINRLSDLLFVAARLINEISGEAEEAWTS